jgi:CheY-like chemotaxis protein
VAGETILIVEDNPLNLELISDILEAHDYQVKAATTGSEALKMVEESRPDLILMDIQLPGLDGLTITGMIKGEARK